MIFHTYAIEGFSLRDAKGMLERSLLIQFEERDSSWYASVYYRYVSDKEHELRLCLNEDFEGEVIDDGIERSAVLLQCRCPTEHDTLLRQLDALRFLRKLR